MRIKKLSLSLILVFSLSLLLISNTFAAPRWNYAASVDPSLAFNGSTAECFANISGKDGVTKIVATVELQVKNSSGSYVRSASWSTRTVYGTDLSFSEFAYNRPAGEYRLIVNATFYNASGASEKVYAESYATCRG